MNTEQKPDPHDPVEAVLDVYRDNARLRAENQAVKDSWAADADHRDELFVVIQMAYRQLSNTNPDHRDRWVNRALTTLADVLSEGAAVARGGEET